MTQWPPGCGWDEPLASPQSSTRRPQWNHPHPMGVAGPSLCQPSGAAPGVSQAQPALWQRQVDFVPPGDAA